MVKINILIVGSRGFIGKHLVIGLSQYHNVIEFDLQNFNDLSEITHLCKAFSNNNIELVIDLASYCIVRDSINNPDKTFTNNVLGIHNLMETMRIYGTKRIIFTSSERVYDPLKSKIPINEDSPLSSLNPYVASKIYSEELIKAYSNCYGLNYTVFRLSTVFGEGDTTNRLIPLFIRSAFEDRELKIFQKEKKTLDITYVKDVICAITMAVKNIEGKFTNEIFNVSSNYEVSIEEIADFIIRSVGEGRKKIIEEEYKTQPTRVLLDNSKLKNMGWCPLNKYELFNKLSSTIEWWYTTYYKVG